MKVLFCGGGTAGHITPALALCEQLQEDEFAFVGREGGKENEIITQGGYKLFTVSISGFERRLSTNNVKSALKLLKAIGEARKILNSFIPDVVIGMGGYVCFPILYAARKLKIPTAIHESNSTPGLATKILAKKCDRLFISNYFYNKSLSVLPQTRNFGNPVKEEFCNITRDEARKRLGIPKDVFFILSVGGSGGAEIINRKAIALMKDYSLSNKKIKHLHSCGKKHFEKLSCEYPTLCRGVLGCKITPYIFNMPECLAACDVVITRCGAMTLSEITAVGTIPILVPSPNVTGNHQYKNAIPFKMQNAGILIEEKDLSYAKLTEAIELIRNDKILRLKMKNELKKMATPNAKQKIIEELRLLAKS